VLPDAPHASIGDSTRTELRFQALIVLSDPLFDNGGYAPQGEDTSVFLYSCKISARFLVLYLRDRASRFSRVTVHVLVRVAVQH